MRCVSLKDITQFINNFSYVVYYEKFKPNEQKYHEMWLDQGPEFWVKFVVTLKYYFKYKKEYLYGEDFESELVTFLKVLSHNKFSEILCYVENAATRHYNFVHALTKSHPVTKEDNCVELFTPAQVEEMKAIIVLTILAGCLVEVLPAWETALPGDNFEFNVPRAWTVRYSISQQSISPLESFIISKWGGSDSINQILCCKLENIVWWKDRAEEPKHVYNPHFTAESAPPLTAGNVKQIECLNLGSEKLTDLYFYFKTTECYKKQYWMRTLPATMAYVVDHDNVGAVKMLKKWLGHDVNKQLIAILNNLCPPLLHQKYYQINIASLASKDNTYLKVAPWFALMLESAGEELMNRLNDLQEKTLENTDDDMYDDFSDLHSSSKRTRDKFGTMYTGEECVDKLADFLFEPCVLIELMSNIVLMRQWLSAALITVLKFELEIVEFAHWPIPEDIEPLIRELVSIIINTKERILLGFFITNFDIIAFPYSDARVSNIVMDDVVLRALPVLKFISSKNSFKIVTSLKNKCFKTERSLSSRVQLNESVYGYKSDVKIMYLNFFAFFNFWTTNHKYSLFSTMELRYLVETRDFLNSSYKPPPPKPGAFYIKKNCTENPSCRCCASKNFFAYTNKTPYDFSDAITEVIRKIIIPCHHFTQRDCEKLLKMFSKETLEGKSFSVKPFQLPYEQAAAATMCFQSVSAYLEISKHETGIMSCVTRLSAQVSAKDQLTKLIAACALLLEQVPRACDHSRPTCPVYCHVTVESSTLNKDRISKTIKSLHEESRRQTRGDLWSQFPDEWKKPVRLQFEIPDYENTLSDVISSFEVRIGRMFWHATKCFFNIRNTKNSFPYLVDVHYLLPCLVSSLLDVDKLPKTVQNAQVKINIVKFLSSVISYFEKAFHEWIQGTLVPFTKRDGDINEDTQDLHVVEYNTKITKFAMHGFMLMNDVEDKFSGGLSHFKLILQSIPAFNFSSFSMDSDLYDSEPLICRAITISFKQALNESCLNAISLPLDDSESLCSQLQEFYFTSMVIYQMMIIIRLQDGFHNASKDEISCYKTMSIELDVLMYELFSLLFKTKGKSDCGEEVSTFIEGKRTNFLNKFFDHIVSIRKNHVQNMKRVNLLPKYGSKKFESVIDSFYSGKIVLLPMFINKSTLSSKPKNSKTMASSEMKLEKESLKSDLSNPEQEACSLSFTADKIVGDDNTNMLSQLESKVSKKKKRNRQKKKSANPNCNNETCSSKSASTETQKSQKYDTSPSSVEPEKIGKKTNERTQLIIESGNSLPISNSNAEVRNKVAEATRTRSGTIVVTESSSANLLKCNSCGRLEEIPGSFVPCPKCMSKPFPVTNYFCNMACYEKRWGEKHRAEHLEFELGLFDL